MIRSPGTLTCQRAVSACEGGRGASPKRISSSRPASRRSSSADVRKFTPEAAEKIARQLLAKIALGGDPGAEKKKAKLATSTWALTFGKVADRYRAVRNWAPRT